MAIHPMLLVVDLHMFMCAPYENTPYYSVACKKAADEFQRRTGLKLWYRYHTLGDVVTAQFDADTGEMFNILARQRGFPAGCLVAFVYNRDLFLGSSFCCRRDRNNYSKYVGRWQAIRDAKLILNWRASASFLDSAKVAQQFSTISNRVAIADYHQWLCRNKLMVLDVSNEYQNNHTHEQLVDYCEGERVKV